MGLRAVVRRLTTTMVITIAVAAPPVRAADRDPLAQAVVDSLASTSPTSPRDLLDAVMKATKVEAYDVAATYLARLDAALAAAGDRRPELLADFGDTFGDGTLLALDRRLAATEPAISKLVDDIRTASRLRRRDPKRLAAALDDLTSDSFSRRAEATRRLSLAGEDALGPLVGWLGDPRHASGTGEADLRARHIVRDLVRKLGDDGLVALLGWLGTPDVANWPGILSAIDLAAASPARVRRFLLAPALVVDTPPEARRRAEAALERLAGGVPTKSRAVEELTHGLDGLLCGDTPPHAGHEIDTGSRGELVPFWNPAKRSLDRVTLTARQRRSLESAHLARDLAALLGTDAADRRLVRLAQLESTLLSVDRADATAGERIIASLTDADGFSPEAVAEVLDEAVARGMTEAAEAASTVIGAKAGGPEPAMPPSVRAAVVRAMDCGDLGVRFAAARTLAVAGPTGPYAGRSRMLETLLDAATSRGAVRAVVAHPDRFERQRLVSSVAALGYTPTEAVRAREAVVAVRESCDTRVVVLGDRLGPPGAHETAQFVSRIPTDGPLRIVFAVDGRDTEQEVPAVSDGDRRKAAERLARADESIRLVTKLARDGEPVSAAVPLVLEALSEPGLAVAAVEFLAVAGRPEAQAALQAILGRPNASDDLRERALDAFRESVGRFGILLETCAIADEYRRYNTSADPAARRWSGLVLDVLEAPRQGDPPTPAPSPSGDAPNPK